MVPDECCVIFLASTCLPEDCEDHSFSVAKWNTLKGGGDAITKLIDSCRECIGIRGDCTVACARVIMYFAVVFHRFNGILSAAKSLDEYATIAHYRNAASHRYTMAESMDLLIEKVLELGGIISDDNSTELMMPSTITPSGAFAPSPLGQVTVIDQSTGRGQPIDNAKQMPFATWKSNTTPGQGKDVHVPDEWFELRADSCEGCFWGKRLKPPNQGSKPHKGSCSVCKRETAWYCFGCRRYLCNIPPQQKLSVKKKVKKKAAKLVSDTTGMLIQSSRSKGTKKKKSGAKKKKSVEDSDEKRKKKRGKKGSKVDGGKKSKKEQAKDVAKARKKKKKLKEDLLKKYPRRFTLRVPVLKDRKLVTDEDGVPCQEDSYGEYTCYHIAHLECWKTCCHENTVEVQAAVTQQTEKAERDRKRREEEQRQQQQNSSKRSRHTSTGRPTKPRPFS